MTQRTVLVHGQILTENVVVNKTERSSLVFENVLSFRIYTYVYEFHKHSQIRMILLYIYSGKKVYSSFTLIRSMDMCVFIIYILIQLIESRYIIQCIKIYTSEDLYTCVNAYTPMLVDYKYTANKIRMNYFVSLY